MLGSWSWAGEMVFSIKEQEIWGLENSMSKKRHQEILMAHCVLDLIHTNSS